MGVGVGVGLGVRVGVGVGVGAWLGAWPVSLLTLLVELLGLWPLPLFELGFTAARDLLEAVRYVEAVGLPEAGP